MLRAISLKRKDICMYSLLNSYDMTAIENSNKEVCDFTKIRSIISSYEKKIIVFMGKMNFLDRDILVLIIMELLKLLRHLN